MLQGGVGRINFAGNEGPLASVMKSALTEWLRGERDRVDMSYPRDLTGVVEERLAMALGSRALIVPPLKHADKYFRFDASRETWLTSPAPVDRVFTEWVPLDFGDRASDTSLSSTIVGCPYGGPEDLNRAMVRIGRGADATESVEYDLQAEAPVADGLRVPRSVHDLSWDGPDAILVTRRSTGPDGADQWVVDRIIRGCERSERLHTYAVERVVASLVRDATADEPRYFSTEWLDHRRRRYRVGFGRAPSSTWQDLPVPPDVRTLLQGEWAVLLPLATWTPHLTTFGPGDVLVARLDDLLTAPDRIRRVWTCGPNERLARLVLTRRHVVATLRRPTRTAVISVRMADGAVVELSSVDGSYMLRTSPVDVLDDRTAEDVWMVSSGPTQPPSLHLLRAGEAQRCALVQPGRRSFRHERYDTRTVETVAGGHRLRYTLVAPRDTDPKSPTPVVVSGYGGFNVPETVDYLDVTGPSWLDPVRADERPGAFVFAHVAQGVDRGAPPWIRLESATQHFLAVVDHLIAEGLSRSGLVGASGVSHGSLLVMNAVLQRPDLFGAVACRSGVFDLIDYPVLDGTAWTDEYGDPRDEMEREHIRRVSPVHRSPSNGSLPPALLWCAADDDRVDPTHSRRMTQRLRALGGRAWYLESPAGGHDGLGVTAAGNRGHAITGLFFRRYLTHASAR